MANQPVYYKPLEDSVYPSTNLSMSSSDNFSLGLSGEYGFDYYGEPDTIYTTAVERFAKVYAKYHGTLSVVLTSIGICSNTFFLTVLTRHRSLFNPTNSLLKAVAVTDVLLLILYAVYTVKFQLLHGARCSTHSLGWAIFMLIYAYASISVYGSSVYLLVLLGAYRIYVVHLKRANLSGHGTKVLVAAGITILAAQLFCLPHFCSIFVVKATGFRICDEPYHVSISPLAKKHTWLASSVFWINGIGFKAVPCLLLTIIIILLMIKLSQFHKRNHQLLGRRSNNTSSHANLSMLAILLVFICTQMPQAVLNICSGVYGKRFKNGLYNQLGDVMDLLSIVNSVISLPLYCLTNSAIRSQVRKTLDCRLKPFSANQSPSTVRTNVIANNSSVAPRSPFQVKKGKTAESGV